MFAYLCHCRGYSSNAAVRLDNVGKPTSMSPRSNAGTFWLRVKVLIITALSQQNDFVKLIIYEIFESITTTNHPLTKVECLGEHVRKPKSKKADIKNNQN